MQGDLPSSVDLPWMDRRRWIHCSCLWPDW